MNHVNVSKIAPAFLKLAKRGFCKGIGRKSSSMCVEAAISCSIDPNDPLNDHPVCTDYNLSCMKININDKGIFTSEKDRARQLVRLGILQLGTGYPSSFDFNVFKQQVLDEVNFLASADLRKAIAEATTFQQQTDAIKRLQTLRLIDRITYLYATRKDTLLMIRAMENVLTRMKTPGAKWLAKNPRALRGWPLPAA